MHMSIIRICTYTWIFSSPNRFSGFLHKTSQSRSLSFLSFFASFHFSTLTFWKQESSTVSVVAADDRLLYFFLSLFLPLQLWHIHIYTLYKVIFSFMCFYVFSSFPLPICVLLWESKKKREVTELWKKRKVETREKV